jgi:hypothetical protein
MADLVEFEGSQYTSDNGSIRLLKELPLPRPVYDQRATEPGLLAIEPLYNQVAIACLSTGQYDSFMNYARKHGWDRFARFEPIYDLSRPTVERLDKNGFKLLIAHVDQTHPEVRKVYKTKGSDLAENLPKDWQIRKILNENYAGIQFGYRLLFKA